MGENPKAVLRQAADDPKHLSERVARTQCQRDAQIVLNNLHDHQVFYYPRALEDWGQLRHLTHLCDTFIFCDWNVAAKIVTGDFNLPGLRADSIVPLETDTVAYLSNSAALPANIIHDLPHPAVGQPWGIYAQLTRSVGNVLRPIHLFCLGMNAETAFFNLFIPRSTAPKVICQDFSIGDVSVWDRPLGQLVRRCETRPTFLVSNRGKTPYTEHWQRFGNWFSSWVAQDYRPEPVQAKPVDGARRVIVKRGQLTPETVAVGEAIVLPVDRYTRHQQQWPVGARILLAPDDQAGQILGQPDNVEFLGHRYAPLGDVLECITKTCVEHAVSRVSSVGIGYEDEGPVLDQWRRQPGLPLELTIYCECEGDVAAFGPYADEIR